MTLTGKELAEELRSTREQLMADGSYASDAEVARLALFSVYGLMGRLADYLHPQAAAPLPGQQRLFPEEAAERVRIEFVTPQEIADALPISLTSVYKLLRSGSLPAKRVGSRWIIRRSEFESWEMES
jgi:excisionase family DNA binding protein